jgi:GNAT superfamily N-acetyltransferase
MTTQINIRRLSGAALNDFIPDLARLRIEVFRDFPYLYDGTIEYEEQYLQTYINTDESVIVLALDGDQVIGASTGIPMRHESREFIQPFLDHGYDIDKIFYCAESVLNHDYRGHGLGVRFFEEREAHARELGGFDYTSFCCVNRAEDHPLRPGSHVPLDKFWSNRGYTRHPELVTRYKWKDLNQTEETYKSMTFWLKPCE